MYNNKMSLFHVTYYTNNADTSSVAFLHHPFNKIGQADVTAERLPHK